MNRTALLPALAALFTTAGSATAQEVGAIVIGGEGSCSSNGTSNPGLLSDGLTEGAARMTFALDAQACQLTVVFENTSPVQNGVPNPLATAFLFNVPGTITDMSLASQSGAGGAPPSFLFNFDADRVAKPNNNLSSVFGSFNARLSLSNGVQGGIANPDADTINAPLGSEVIGPATFVFDLTGDLTGLSGVDFAAEISSNPPGNKPVVGVAKFQSGGQALSSGSIGPSTNFCPVAAELKPLGGGGCGQASLDSTLPIMGQTTEVTVTGGAPSACAVIYASRPGGTPYQLKGCEVMLDKSTMYKFNVMGLDVAGSATMTVPISSYNDSPSCCGLTVDIQAALFDVSLQSKRLLEITNSLQLTIGS